MSKGAGISFRSAENRVLVFFQRLAAQRALVFRLLPVELAVALEGEIDVVILVERELGREFGTLLALETGNRAERLVCEQFLHFGVAQHAPCDGVAHLETAFGVLAHVTPRSDFHRLAAFGAIDGVGYGLALELAPVFLPQVLEEFLHVVDDAVAEFYGRELALFHLRELVFPFAGHLGRFDFLVHQGDDFAPAGGTD